MKFRFAALAMSPLLLAVASAQTPTLQPPNIRTGLWQQKVTTTTTGMGEKAPETEVAQACMTPESLRKDLQQFTLGNNNDPDGEQTKCSVSNLHQDAHRVSYDETCDLGAQYKSQIRFEIFFDSAERMHGMAAVTTSGPKMKNMTMNIKIESHYLKSDCGDLQPGDDKTIEQ